MSSPIFIVINNNIVIATILLLFIFSTPILVFGNGNVMVFKTSSERYFGGYYHLNVNSDIPISIAYSESSSTFSNFNIIKENVTNLSIDLTIGKTSQSGDFIIFYSYSNFNILHFSMDAKFENFVKLGPYNIPSRGVQRLFSRDKISSTSYDTKLEIASNRYQQVKVAFTFFEKETPIYTSYSIYSSSPKYIPIDFHTSIAVNDSIPIYIHVMCDSEEDCFISNIVITHGSIIGIIFGVLIGVGLIVLIVVFLKVPSLFRYLKNRYSSNNNLQLIQEENQVQLKEEMFTTTSGTTNIEDFQNTNTTTNNNINSGRSGHFKDDESEFSSNV